jgi:hypothetical protein
MKILNIRKGFATNSSSSHSIIIAKNASNKDVNNMCFSYNNFIAKSRSSKIYYFASSLKSSLTQHENPATKSNYSDKIIKSLIKQCFPELSKNDLNFIMMKGYVDSQSLLICPLCSDGTVPIKFYRSLCDEIINNDDLCIIGDNDNYDEDETIFIEHDAYNMKYIFELLINNPLFFIRETEYGWVLFNKYNGTKIRISQSNDLLDLQQPILKPYVPELVDLKITHYCDKNCCFCYQDSIVNGQHAQLFYIAKIIDLFQELGVFEIALGGGDIMQHPDLVDIIQYANEKNIVVNLTIRSFEIIKYNAIIKFLKSITGGIACSITNSDELSEKIVKHVSIHYILGLNEIEDFKKLIDKCNSYNFESHIVLLAYKQLGRATQPSKNYDGWIDIAQTLQHGSISIDTEIAKKYQKELNNSGISHKLYDISDGIYSKYIDAVEMTIAPSSFDKENSHKFSLNNSNNDDFRILLMKNLTK